MDNENIESMTDSDFDHHVEGLSAAKAQNEIDNLTQRVIADPNHPLNRTGVPGHKRIVERRNRLFEQVHSEDPDTRQFNKDGEELLGQVDPRIQKICDDVLKEKVNEQAELVEQGDKLLDELRELGFEGLTRCPDDVDKEQIGIWQMQKLNAEGNYNELGQEIGKTLRASKETQAIQSLFQTFINVEAEINPDLKAKLSYEIISYLNDARIARKENQKKSLHFGG